MSQNLPNDAAARQRWPLWLRAILFSLGYLVCAEVGSFLSAPGTTYVSFWLPAGLYIAVLLLSERREWPWLILAAFPANLAFDLHSRETPLIPIGCFYAANTIQSVLGAWLVQRFIAPRPTLATLKEFVGLLGLSAVLSTAIGAALGAGTLIAFGFSSSFFQSWLVWWGSTAMAILILTPFLLTWFAGNGHGPLRPDHFKRWLESAALLLVTGLFLWQLLFIGKGIESANKGPMLLSVLWAGLRFGPRGAAAMNLLLALAITFCTAQFSAGLSPEQIASGEYIFTLQTTLAVMALVGMIPAIVLGERKRAEREIVALNQRLSIATRSGGIGIWDWDVERNVLVWDEEMYRLFQVRREQFSGAYDAWSSTLHPEDRERAQAEVQNALQKQKTFDTEFRIVWPDGSVRTIQASAQTFYRADGKASRMVGVNVDITERKLAEQRLRESEERFRTLVEFSPEGIGVGIHDRLVYVNPAAIRMLGAERPDQLLGRLVYDFIPSEFHEVTRSRRHAILHDGITVPPMQVSMLRLDGSSFVAEVHAVSCRFGAQPGILNLLNDVTERKRAEVELRLSEEKFAKAFQASPSAMVITRESDGYILEANDSFALRYGVSREAALGKSVLELGVWQDSAEREVLMKRLNAEGAIREHEKVTLLPSGRRSISLLSIERLQLHGEPCLLTVSHDVTELKEAQEALRRSEELFRAIVQDQTEMIVRWKPDGTRTFVNHAYCRVFGGNPEDHVGSSFYPLISPEEQEGFHRRICALNASNPVSTAVHRNLTSGGDLCWQEWTDRGIFDAQGQLVELQSTGRDITERVNAEAALRQSEEKFAKAFLSSPDSISITDLETGQYIDVNDGHRRLFGYAREEVIGRTSLELSQWPSAEDRTRFVETLRTRGSVRDLEVRGHNRHGAEITVLVSAEAIDLGNRRCIVTTVHDITEQRKAEAALRESEKRFRSYFELPIVGLAITSLERGFLEVNDRFCETLAYSRTELVQKRWSELTHPADLHTDLSQFQAVLAGELDDYSLEKRFLRKDGQVIHAAVSVRCVRRTDGSPDYFIGMLQDITRRKHAEESLRHAQARELKAREVFARQLLTAQERERQRLAAELHDSLGQNLSLIKNRARLALEEGTESAARVRHLEAITRVVGEAIAEVRGLVHNLRPIHIEHIGLTDSLEALIAEVAESSGILIERRLEPVDDLFKEDQATNVFRILQEALNNLVKHSEAHEARVTLERDIHCVRLSVADHGRGFDVRGSMGRTGLGLTSLAERARMLCGAFQIESAPGRGTTVTVELPIPDEAGI